MNQPLEQQSEEEFSQDYSVLASLHYSERVSRNNTFRSSFLEQAQIPLGNSSDHPHLPRFP